MTKILMISGSSRKESLNKKLIIAASNIAKEKNANVTIINLQNYDMPIYNGDFEEENGQPENAIKLFKILSEHDALIISSPEYNGLPSALLKNTIDWLSRIDIKIFENKIAAIMSASPGALGGLRGLPHLRTLLNNLNMLVIPQQLAVGNAAKAFDDNGNLTNNNQQATLESIIDNIIKLNQ